MTKKEFFKAWDYKHENDQGIYDAKNNVFYILDYVYSLKENGEFEVCGAMFKEISMEMITAIVELGCEGIENYIRANYPAPGTGSKGKLGFIEFETLGDAWEDYFEEISDNLYTERQIVEALR